MAFDRSREHRYLAPQQLHAVADASGKHRALVLMLGYCGLRWGEAIALRGQDVDLARRRLLVRRNAVETLGTIHEGTPKTRAGARQVPIPRIVADALASVVNGDDDLVFPGPHGGYMRRVRASEGSKSWWKSALRAAGVEPMVLHALRHTAASIAVSAGGNVKAIQRMLGHESAAMTLDIYADLFDDDIDTLLDRIDALANAVVDGKSVAD
ncbi:tyrosine-type recombinase/integrase [Microbacterium sp. NPDC087868]|uniref:tyrosine-type recombinase/integrase n=1 Tax=Microbacterium sp. NPDC087868 TaxID=3364195 RepID=UPI00384EF74A